MNDFYWLFGDLICVAGLKNIRINQKWHKHMQ